MEKFDKEHTIQHGPQQINKETPANEKAFNENSLNPKIETINTHCHEGTIGLHNTDLVMKSESTYLIMTDFRGMKVIKDCEQVYSGSLPQKDSVDGSVYDDHLDCFFFTHGGIIYRKDIDDKPPSVFMNLRALRRYFGKLRYSLKNRRMVSIASSKFIMVVNNAEKRVELDVNKGIDGYISSFRVFGSKGNKVVSVTRAGLLLLHIFCYKLKKLTKFNSFQIELVKGEKSKQEVAESIAVCEENEHILVSIIGGFGFESSKLMIFQLEGETFVKKASLDQTKEEVERKTPFEWFCVFDSVIIWVSLEKLDSGEIRLFCFDLKTGCLKEILKEKDLGHQVSSPKSSHLLNGKLYYAGYYGKVMGMSLDFLSG